MLCEQYTVWSQVFFFSFCFAIVHDEMKLDQKRKPKIENPPQPQLENLANKREQRQRRINWSAVSCTDCILAMALVLHQMDYGYFHMVLVISKYIFLALLHFRRIFVHVVIVRLTVLLECRPNYFVGLGISHCSILEFDRKYDKIF